MIDPNKVIDDAQHLLKKAVNVLEEEIAAGILAAKKMEKKVIDVDEVRDTNPEDLMSRIRRDTHDAIDILLDAFTTLTRHFGSLAESLNKTNGDTPQSSGNGQSNGMHNGQPKGAGPQTATGSQPKAGSGSQQTAAPGPPVIRAEKPAKPGSTIDVPMVLTNDSKDQSIKVTLNRSELIGAGGSKIGARNVKLTPQSFTLEPLQKKEVVIKISIPDSCKEGVYSGLIQDDSNSDIRVILTVQIGKTKS